MRRVDAVLAAIAATAGAVAIAFTWQPGLASLFDDSVSYLVMAQAASPFGEASPAVAEAARFEKYPPLTAWLLALSGGAFDWRVAHAVIALAFAASVYTLGWLGREVTGMPAMGIAAAVCYAFMPGVWLNVKGILSEFPYMALSFAALALHARRAAAPARTKDGVVLGLLLGAALLTRTIGVALVAAVVLAELVRFRRDRDRARLAALAWMAGIPAAAAALWYSLRPADGDDAYASFAASLAEHAVRGGAAFALDLVRANAWALRDAWLNALMVYWAEPWRPGFLLAIALGAAGMATMLARAARGRADGLYLLFFSAIVLVWPFPGQMFRLALPALPLLLVGFLQAWMALAARLSPRGAARSPLGAVLPLVLAAPAALFYIAPRAVADDDEGGGARRRHIAEFYRIPSRASAEASADAQNGVFEDLKRIGETTPPGARVMWYLPSYVALLAGRHGATLERPRDAAHLAAQLRAARADYLYLAELHPRDSAARDGHPLAPLELAQGLGETLWQRPGRRGIGGALIRIDPRKLEQAG